MHQRKLPAATAFHPLSNFDPNSAFSGVGSIARGIILFMVARVDPVAKMKLYVATIWF
ncbi:hypothetical protein L195_g036206 [Trifolium pratense]|uniref:Uncharacterized protein n=1 Tax=Trifolium pratense TaxID=57577 RepID=A0A2K3LNV5_TRIPR|nr:hypothetical protein L195_g048392 [Trifolium pratense]PNX54958.1 hypothetical protein L195_g048581 [Trifolium pratense]PNX80209.1 hypothetical protein L195_g036206 [Trifolium pratense]